MDNYRVLHFGYSSNLGGVEMLIKNIVMYSSIPCDIVVTSKKAVPYEKEIVDHGSKVIRIPPRRENPFSYKKNIEILLKEHPEYKIVHVHLNTASSIESLLAAKALGLRTVVHSHSSNASFGKITSLLHSINRKRLQKLADVKIACSKSAGKFMFGNNFYVIDNGIETERFKYCEEYRKEIRKELCISERDFVILNVGMLYPVKNQIFLLEVLKELRTVRPYSKLILVGDGEDRSKLVEYSKKLGINNDVIFTGKRSDVNKFYSAADVFVLPSLFEGSPLTVIEAQTAGLKCIISDRVSTEMHSGDNVRHVPLDAKKWKSHLNTSIQRSNTIPKGGDIRSTVNEIEVLYKILL